MQKAISEGDHCQEYRRLFEVRFLAAEQEGTSISMLPVYVHRHLTHATKRLARDKRSQPFATSNFQRDTALRKRLDNERKAVV